MMKAWSAGFTLLEMVAVLFIVGLISSIAIPRLPAMQASLDFALKRNSFEQAMNGLAYRAFKENQDFTLAGTYDAKGQVGEAPTASVPGDDGISGKMRTLPLIDTDRRVMMPSVTPAPFSPPLPEGWRMEIAAPIQYRASGYCTGGTADVEIGRRRYAYTLKPPLCEAALEGR